MAVNKKESLKTDETVYVSVLSSTTKMCTKNRVLFLCTLLKQETFFLIFFAINGSKKNFYRI